MICKGLRLPLGAVEVILRVMHAIEQNQKIRQVETRPNGGLREAVLEAEPERVLEARD